jgi:CHC2 zinc finger/RepB DNA-primase from phage plasmid
MATSREHDPAGRLAYLRALAGDAPSSSLFELRYRLPNGGMATEFHPVEDHDRLVASIDRHAADTDVYVGCAPRSRPDGRKQSVREVWVLWAECDGEQAARAARAFSPRPSLVIASGSGPNIHAYWALRTAATPRDAEVANLHLASALGADPVCFDASRILRPPGTWNHKHQPARRVELVDLHLGVQFELDEVVGGLRHVNTSVVERRWQSRDEHPRARRDDALLQIPPPVYVRDLMGIAVAGGRKVRCPFHDDERPSLHVYTSAERGWSCFSCRRGGSIYDLAAELWGMGTKGREFVALRRLLLERFAVEVARAQERDRDDVPALGR